MDKFDHFVDETGKLVLVGNEESLCAGDYVESKGKHYRIMAKILTTDASWRYAYVLKELSAAPFRFLESLGKGPHAGGKAGQ